MKSWIRHAAPVLLLPLLLVAADGAWARGGHGHGHGHFGVFIGAPVFYPWGYWGPYWGAPYPVTREYIYEAAPAYSTPGEPAEQKWYWCRDSQSYYPYVKQCPGGWETVPAKPPK